MLKPSTHFIQSIGLSLGHYMTCFHHSRQVLKAQLAV